jgi:hypothetical protein
MIHDVERLVAELIELPESISTARDAITLVPGRLHLARAPGGAVELFIEGNRESFPGSMRGRGLECGDYQELRDLRKFSALLVRSTKIDVRPMAHVAYEAVRVLESEPNISNERLMEYIAPYLELVLERELLSLEQQLGLLGELLFMNELMNRAVEIGENPVVAVRCWTGWDSASRDFVGANVAVEAKVTQRVGRHHWVHPIYQLLPAGEGAEPVYVFSVGVRVDRSREYKLITAIDRVLDRLSSEHRDLFLDRLRQYGGFGFDGSDRGQYELEPGFLVTQPPLLIRVDHLRDILRPASFADGGIPARVSDIQYVVDLDGLPGASPSERAQVIDALLTLPSS